MQNIQAAIGTYIIGDEILSGKRQDAHLKFMIQALKARGLRLAWAHYLGDVPEQITSLLRASMLRGDIVFSFGGIGATPDDCTRQCAADAANLPIARHAGAVAEIEAQYGENAYPKRVLMADFPLGASLIPNAVNRVPGFSINHHHFSPGFPQMAHPMVEWALETYYKQFFNRHPTVDKAFLLTGPMAYESALLDLMERIVADYPALRLFSLPCVGDDGQRRHLELGVEGEATLVNHAMEEIRQEVEKRGIGWSWRD